MDRKSSLPGASGRRAARPVLVPLLGALLIAFCGLSTGARERAEPRSIAPRGPLAPSEQSMIALFEAAAPSVAYITTEVVHSAGFFGAQVTQQGAGSGFVWDTAGHIVTNNHVVEGASHVFVQLDAGDPIEARVIGASPEYDLAVIKLLRPPRGLRPIGLGTSSDLKIGQSVYAIGNPFGLQRTLTHGIVSALDRELPTSYEREIAGVIQTDAAINPGNSGGPLLDSAGRLVGVNTAIRSDSGSSAGIGFAIPVDLVNRVVPSLISRGRAPLPGIGITPVRPDLVERAGIAGVVIAEVRRGTPAAEAGLRPMNPKTGDLGDVIVGVNGKRIETLSNFVAELGRSGVDAMVDLTVVRDDRERKVRVRVIEVGR
ncbi:MAG TPA: trypsin-like peptidase domain-containing protein [Burkholderiaceae bacterium]|nr:trypsin-like peptidase domain-containing protein [Burkholderiaceae bacterium]